MPVCEKEQKKNNTRRTAPWITGLLVISACTIGIWYWYSLYAVPHRLNFVLISVNHEPQKILAGETRVFHPRDRVKILKISTSIPFNLNVRLAAKHIDINMLRDEEMGLFDLLPDREELNHYRFPVWIKYRNENLGHMDWDVRPYVEDWLDKADRIINPDQRLTMLKRAIVLSQGDKQIERRLLDEYKSQKLWKQSALMLEDMAEKNMNRDILMELLDAYTEMHSRDGIISVLKRLVKLNPDDLEFRNSLAEIFEETGKLNAAIEENKELLKRVEKQDSVQYYKQLGYLYSKTGQPKKAIFYYLGAAKLDKKDANLYYNLSYLYEKIDQKDKGYFYLDKAVKLKSGDLESRLKLAQRLMAKGELEKAGKYLAEIVKKKPKSLEALLLLARLMEKKGDKKELKKTYTKIFALEQKNETVIYNLGVLEYEEGNSAAALDYFKKYLKFQPRDAEAHGIIFDIYKKWKNSPLAFKEAKILVKLRPKETSAYHYIFDYLSHRGDYEKIIPVMEQGLRKNPGQINLMEYLVLAYLKTGKEKPAVTQIKKILKIRPKDVGFLLHLAGIQEKLGNSKEALENYKRIIDISPDHEEAEEGYLRLRLKSVQGE